MKQPLGPVSRSGFLATVSGFAGTLATRSVAGADPLVDAVQLKVSSTPAGSLAPGLAGFSYEKSKLATPFFASSNRPLVDNFKLLGKSALRIGGNSADRMSWAPAGAGLTRGQVAPGDIDRLASFLRATGWRLIYTINLGKNSPDAAAAEAAVVAATVGSNLLSFEIGNEGDDYSNY